MRKVFVFLFITSMLIFADSVSAANLELVNKTSCEVSEIYISDSGKGVWEKNILEGFVLPIGNQITVDIPIYKAFDLYVICSNDEEEDYNYFPGSVYKIVLKDAGMSNFYK